MTADPRAELTRWHAGYRKVSPETKVYHVGRVSRLMHLCPEGGEAQELVFYQPLYNACAACYCAHCDTLYVNNEVISG